MKGITFTIIVEIIIAIAAIIILFSLLQTMIFGAANSPLCPVYHGLRALPLPGHLKPYVPECEGVSMTTQRLTLKRELTDKALLEFIVKCWERNDYGKGGADFICYELFLRDVESGINETTLTEFLKDEGWCDRLPNNFLEAEGKSFDCGEENKLLWKIGNIQGKDITVIIKYDAFNHRINII